MGIDVILSAAARRSVASLAETADQQQIASNRLATRRSINAAIDGPADYFNAKALDSRAAGLTTLLDDMGQAVQTLAAAEKGMTAIGKMLEVARSKITSAQAETDPARRAGLADEFTTLLRQIEGLAKDSTYKGKGLLAGAGNDLSVSFDEENLAKLQIKAVDYTVASFPGGLAVNDAANGWATPGDLDTAMDQVVGALARVRQDASSFGSSKAMIENRQSFARTIINTLTSGSENLTAADLNEEGAKLLALQTRQSLSTSALSLANGADSAVMRLFGG